MNKKYIVLTCLILSICVFDILKQHMHQNAFAQAQVIPNTINENSLQGPRQVIVAAKAIDIDEPKPLEIAPSEQQVSTPPAQTDNDNVEDNIKDNAQLNLDIDDLEKLSLEIDEETKRLESLKDDIIKQTVNIKAKNKKLKIEIKKIDKKNKVIQEKNEKLKAESLKLETESSILESALSKIGADSEKFESEIAVLEAQNLEIIAKSKQLKSQKELIIEQSKNIKAENFKYERARIDAESAKLEAQKELLAQQIKSIQEESLRLEAESAKLEDESIKLETENAKFNKQTDKATRQKPRDKQAEKLIPEVPRPKAEEDRTLTPIINEILRAEQFGLNIDVYSTDEGATVKLISTEPMLFRTMQLKNPNRAVIIIEGILHTKIAQIPYNRVLDSINMNTDSGKTRIILNLKLNSATTKYINRDSRTLDIRVR